MQTVDSSTAEMMCSPYLFAVIVTAWFGGFAMDYVFRAHRSSVVLTDMIGLLVFAAVSILVVWLTVGHRQAQGARRALLVERERGRRETEAANRAKHKFLAILGDRMRTALAAITSAASALTRLVRDDTHMRQASDVSTRRLDHLWTQVEDLLDIGRITTGEMVLHRWPRDLAEVVLRRIESGQAARRIAWRDRVGRESRAAAGAHVHGS
jgi:signal transduction histidine kinase